MSNFLIFKAGLHNSTTPAIGTYTAEGAAAYFNRNPDISPDYYLYGNTSESAIRWFVPTKETTDFEFVADILTTEFNDYFTYFIIADSTGTTRLRMWSINNFVYFANDDSNAETGTQYIGRLSDEYIGGFEVFHRFRVRVRKLTASSSSVEIYVDGTRKLTATTRAAPVTCAKIGFMGGVNDPIPQGTRTGIQNTYLYDLSDGDVVDRGVLSGAFNRFISWMKSKFALKSDIPTVNDATLTIQQNGVNVQTFTANASANATANIQCVDLSTAQTVGGIKTFSNAPVVGSINLDGKTIDTDANGNMTFNGSKVLTSADRLPIGSYIQFAGSQAPDGFLVCNGGAISRTTYSALFAVIGTTYGSGDGSTTFNLPNLTDRFLQGSTTSGTVINAGLPNITGSIFFTTLKSVDVVAENAFYGEAKNYDWTSSVNQKNIDACRMHLDASRSSSIYGNSSTVQPPALTCLICIKY